MQFLTFVIPSNTPVGSLTVTGGFDTSWGVNQLQSPSGYSRMGIDLRFDRIDIAWYGGSNNRFVLRFTNQANDGYGLFGSLATTIGPLTTVTNNPTPP